MPKKDLEIGRLNQENEKHKQDIAKLVKEKKSGYRKFRRKGVIFGRRL